MANPFPLEFEELAPFFQIQHGRCTVYEGPAPSPFPQNPATPINNIRLDQAWGVTFHWHTLGALNYLVAGTWELTVYLEEMGVGEINLPGNTMTIPFVSAPHLYTHVFPFAPNVVSREGAYRLVTTVDMRGPTGYQGPISAVGEGPLIRFYQVGP